MKVKFLTLLLMIPLLTSATSPSEELYDHITPRIRVIIDNDFSGDPDGLFQLVQHVLSPSVDIRGIIGSHLNVDSGFDKSDDTAKSACDKVNEIISLLAIDSICPLVSGASHAMVNQDSPIESEGANRGSGVVPWRRANHNIRPTRYVM